jgi:hypothetical protein
MAWRAGPPICMLRVLFDNPMRGLERRMWKR